MRRHLCSLLFLVATVLDLRGQYWETDTTFVPVLERAGPWAFGTNLLAAAGSKVLLSDAPYAINGARPPAFARLNPDGSLDTTFNPPAGGRLSGLASYADGRVLVQRTVAGSPADDVDIIRLQPNGAIDGAFAPAVLSRGTSASAQLMANGSILLTGSFTTVNAVARRMLCVLNADGSVSDAFHSPFTPNAASGCTAVPLPDGKIVIFGSFFDLGPAKLAHLARLNADGSIDGTFNTGAIPSPDQLAAVFPSGEGLLIATGSSLIRLNADGSRDAGYSPQFGGTRLRFGPQQSDGKLLYLVDTLTPATELRRLNANGTPDPAFVVSTPQALAYGVTRPVIAEDGSYYIPSALTEERYSGGFAVSHVLTDGRVDPGFSPRFASMGQVDAFHRQPDGKVILAGAFERVNGTVVANGYGLLRLNADGSLDPAFSAALGTRDRISGLRLQPDGKIVAIGSFPDGEVYHSFARFNANGARAPSFPLPDRVGTNLAIDPDGNIYGVTFNAEGVGQLTRYTPDGNLDANFRSVLTGNAAAFAASADGTVVVADGTGGLVRLLHQGSIDPSFKIDPARVPPGVFGLIALLDGQVVAVGSTQAGYSSALGFTRFTRSGAADYTFYGPSLNTSPPLLFERESLLAAGVVFDALRASGAVATTDVRADLVFGSSKASFSLTAAGRLTSLTYSQFSQTFSAWVRTSSSGPSVDPKPVVLQQLLIAPAALLLGGRATFSVTAGGLFPLDYQWMKDGLPIAGATSATYRITSAQVADAGNYTLVISNAYGSATTTAMSLSVNGTIAAPVIQRQPMNQAVAAGASAYLFSASASGNPIPAYQWLFNGLPIPDATAGTTLSGTISGSSLYFANVQPENVGLYSAMITNSAGTVTTAPAVLSLTATAKTVGSAAEVGPNIVHANGNVYDQLLLQGAAAAITADPGQVSRISYIDLNDDIVQVEFSGAGSLSLVLAGSSGPAAPANYHQPGVSYMKGHAGIVIAGANESTHVSVFSVGRITAINQALFKDNTAYDGVADLAYIAILSNNGKFGGLRCANTNFFASKGLTGLYAPGVRFTGPVYVGEITAFDDANPTLILGSADGDTLITGGDLAQPNGRAVQVSGLTRLKFVSGTTSHGGALPAQLNQARLEQNGIDVTAQIVVNPTP